MILLPAATGQQMFTAKFGAMYHAAPNKDVGHISSYSMHPLEIKNSPAWLWGACLV